MRAYGFLCVTAAVGCSGTSSSPAARDATTSVDAAADALLVDAAADALLVDAVTVDAADVAPSTDVPAVDGATIDVPAVSDATFAVDAPRDPLNLSHDLRLVVEPGDHGAALVAAIRAARRSVHMTMYLLTARDILDALVDAQRRGLEVQVVLNRTLPGGALANTASYDTLTQAGIAVHWSPSRFSFTHEKCVIVDGVEAWVMTMNATQAGLDANREFLVVDHEPDDVRDAESVFLGDFAGTPVTAYAGRMVLAPLNAQARIGALIATATRTIDIESEEMEDRTTGRALQARLAAGVAVRIVLPDTAPTASAMHTLADLVAAGARVVTVHAPYMHAKAVVVDGARAYVGSANLSYISLTTNRELGVLLDAPDAVRTLAATVATDFAAGLPY